MADLYRLVGGFTAAAPLSVAEDSSGVHYRLSSQPAVTGTVNITGDTTYTLDTGVDVTVTGGDVVTYQTALDVCGYMFWCAQTVTQFTANQDNWAFPNPGVVFRISTDASRDLTGLVARTVNGNAQPQLAVLVNTGSNPLVLKHESGSSTAANRFSLPGSSDFSLAGGATAPLWYDPTTQRWRLFVHVPAAGTDEKVKVSSNDTTSDYLINKLVGAGGITITELNNGGNEDVEISVGDAAVVPKWLKVTKTHADFNAASPTETITVYTMPARSCLMAAVIKHTAAWTGGSITNYAFSLSYDGTPVIPSPGLDAATAPSDTGFLFSDEPPGTPHFWMESFAAGLLVELQAAATGGNVADATAGSIDIYLLVGTLP